MSHLMLLLFDPATDMRYIIHDHLEDIDYKDWNTAVELMGEIEDMVQVILQTHDDE